MTAMTDPRIIPLLDPTPTDEEMQAEGQLMKLLGYRDVWLLSGSPSPALLDRVKLRAEYGRVRIARETIEWCAGEMQAYASTRDKDARLSILSAAHGFLSRITDHDAALAERTKP
jgi:hypothetical protein